VTIAGNFTSLVFPSLMDNLEKLGALVSNEKCLKMVAHNVSGFGGIVGSQEVNFLSFI